MTAAKEADKAIIKAIMCQSPIKVKEGLDYKINVVGMVVGLVFSITLAATPFIAIFTN